MGNIRFIGLINVGLLALLIIQHNHYDMFRPVIAAIIG